MDKDPSSLDPDIIDVLKGLESQQAEYPPELLTARRDSFLKQLASRIQVDSEESLTPQDKRVLVLLGKLKDTQPDYPNKLMAARRSMFRQHVAQLRRVSVWDVMVARVQSLFSARVFTSDRSPLHTLRTSLTVAAFALAVTAGLAFYAGQSISTSTPPDGIMPVGHTFLTPTSKSEVLCKEGFEPPLCLAKEMDKSHDLTDPDNGRARPAVAKDTMPGYGQLHRAENINDGLYGPGASWVSNSPNSWIKIDLGKVTAMNTVAFGRDRLGNFNDGDPGRFVIALATADDVYANGDSSNDESEYLDVFDSKDAGFDGIISGSETVIAQFTLTEARYVKITFENAGTAVDEVEVFVADPPVAANDPPDKPDRDLPPSTVVVLASSTPRPQSTATSLPTNTPVPTATEMPLPTATLFIPTNTPEPPPTHTPILVPTNTSVPAATETDEPDPENTTVPADTQNFHPTDTPVPPQEQPPILPEE